jgi:hypothetical protein
LLVRVPLLLLAVPVWVALGALRRLFLLSRLALKTGLVLGLAGLVATTLAVRARPYPTDRLDPGRGGPLVLEDRQGRVLYRRPSPDGRPGRRGWVTLDQISSHAVLTVLASEDRSFFAHRGVDPVSILRAVALNLRVRRMAYGGSTITMQLVRMIHSRSKPRTLDNKAKEAVLALRLERTLTKEQILEQYLNRAYYGHGAYGMEAAAQRYFGKPAASLSPGEATLLAVIPRAPSYYDPIRHLSRTLRRRRHVLRLLVAQGLMSREEAARARAERVRPRLCEPPLHAPHFVQLVLDSLPEDVKRRGGTVRTTLDLSLQQRLERRVAAHVASLRHRRVRQAGLVVLNTATGEIRAMVGSAGAHTPGGQVNITVRRRHPGSALKPFVYALALERGDHPGTIAYDINELPGSAYRLMKVTQPERGPVRYRGGLWLPGPGRSGDGAAVRAAGDPPRRPRVVAPPAGGAPALLSRGELAGHGHAGRPGGAPAHVRSRAPGGPAIPGGREDGHLPGLRRHGGPRRDPRAHRGRLDRQLRRQAGPRDHGHAGRRTPGARRPAHRRGRRPAHPAAPPRHRRQASHLSPVRHGGGPTLPPPQGRVLREGPRASRAVHLAQTRDRRPPESTLSRCCEMLGGPKGMAWEETAMYALTGGEKRERSREQRRDCPVLFLFLRLHSRPAFT